MTKNQKMLLGVGVLGVAGYLIWKQNQKPAAASFVGDRRRNAVGSVSGGLTFTGKPCTKSPANALESSLPTAVGGFPAGTPIYECCKSGQFGTALGSTGCASPKMTTISMLTPASKGGF